MNFIAIVDQSQTLCFYDLSGKQIGNERSLGYDGLSVRFSPTGEYLVICGSNKRTNLYTKEGVLINSICELESWVKRTVPNPLGTHVAVGTENGDIAVYELIVSTVHSLYKERYAFRHSMTDVIIQNLIIDDKDLIKCRDLIKNLAIYKNRLAIQLPEKIIVYEFVKDQLPQESPPDATKGMHYKVRSRILRKFESCNLLVVGAESVVLNIGKKLQCINFDGIVEREWILDSFSRYVRSTGGPSGKEGVLLGLRNGQILQIFVNNPFPIYILKLESAVRSLDMSMNRKRLAVVDDQGICHVFDTTTKELLFQANVVSFLTNCNLTIK
jgi:intraflagellar transport protein 122